MAGNWGSYKQHPGYETRSNVNGFERTVFLWPEGAVRADFAHATMETLFFIWRITPGTYVSTLKSTYRHPILRQSRTTEDNFPLLTISKFVLLSSFGLPLLPIDENPSGFVRGIGKPSNMINVHNTNIMWVKFPRSAPSSRWEPCFQSHLRFIYVRQGFVPFRCPPSSLQILYSDY